MKIENEHILKQAFKDGINLFVGAGFSVMAKNRNGRSLPVGIELIQELKTQFNLKNIDGLSLSQICTIIESERKEDLYSYFKQRFSIKEYDEKYNYLTPVKIKTIFTTNIDNLIHQIYANNDTYYLNDITIRGPAYNDKSAIDFVPLHGTIVNENSQLLFGDLDLASAFSVDPDRWHFLTGRIQSFPSLFWGYKINDASVLHALNPGTIHGRPQKEKWIILTDENQSSIQYFKALNFNIIISNTQNMLDYIESLNLSPLKKISISIRNTESLFPGLTVPSLGSVPARPLLDFYLGDPPTWHDIFSGRLHQIEHFSKIKDSIYSKTNTFVIGIPACGKTTLMMQLAANIKFDGHKLISDSLTLERANFILRKLHGDKAILFIDNFSDDVEAIEMLLSSSKVLLVCFDREYNFDLISHRINKNFSNIIDITSLSDRDIQNIYSRIPPEIRQSNLSKPKMEEESIAPSIYEIVELNIKKSSLSERFKSVLKDLEKKNKDLNDLLLMCCYVHSCRTPVSFEMAYAFLRDVITDYKDVFKMISNLGALLSEYTGSLVDIEKQDYFVPRSTIVSESILNHASESILKRMLVRFHKCISPMRICRFDVFCRRAYDANLMLKAFCDWEDGENFYRSLYNYNKSPFLKQQGALYLAHKRRFKEAFIWIDEALVESKYKIPSIQNSHAIILFRANIDSIAHDNTAHDTVKRSMDILKDCYMSDKRKAYHALVFADHALHYWKFFRNSLGKEYLETSKKWLEEEMKHASWNRNMHYLYKLVSNKLNSE